MASDLPRQAHGLCRAVDDAPRLNARDRPISLAGRKNISTAPVREVEAQCSDCLLVQSNDLVFARFLFRDCDMRSELVLFFVIDVLPAELQQIADAEAQLNQAAAEIDAGLEMWILA